MNAERSGEPKPPKGVPPKPDFLCPAARAHWDELVPILLDLNLLTDADGDALGLYCQSLARLAECEKVLTKEGLTYTQLGDDGSIRMIRARPEQRMAKELYTTVSRLGQQFGLSPSSRANFNIEVKSGPKDAAKEDFFRTG